jgi:hypothetical protein
MSDLAAALMVAIRVHAATVDKQGEPYLLHILRVAEAVKRTSKATAVLHDVFEDSDLLPRQVADDCDLDDRERQALALLTRGDGESYRDYIGCLVEGEGAGGDLAREVKIADLRDNLGRVPSEPGDDCSRCEGSGTLNPGLSGCAYCSSTGFGPERVRWLKSWASLVDRYEKALATLEGSQG